MFLTIDVLEVDVLVVDVIELEVLGAHRSVNNNSRVHYQIT